MEAIIETTIALKRAPHNADSDFALLSYLKALTFTFERDGQIVNAVLTYAEPDPEHEGLYRAVVAEDSGYEGIACVDDTARAALLAFAIYERTGSRAALQHARSWLSFVEYMQYPDGSFANFIRNAAGVRNATGRTSHKGGYWWSARALRALARAYRLTRNPAYLERFEACKLDPLPDGKINGLLALANMDLYLFDQNAEAGRRIEEYCDRIARTTGASSYLLDHPRRKTVNLWGYHQLRALAEASQLLDRRDYLELCRSTVRDLIAEDVKARFWHSYPRGRKKGVTAYDITPIVQGLSSMHAVSGIKKYRDLALQGCAWFYGRNDAGVAMYDPTTGRCRDGITDGIASENAGAESAIEAGFAELVRRDLQTP